MYLELKCQGAKCIGVSLRYLSLITSSRLQVWHSTSNGTLYSGFSMWRRRRWRRSSAKTRRGRTKHVAQSRSSQWSLSDHQRSGPGRCAPLDGQQKKPPSGLMTNILYDYVTGRHVAGKLRPWRPTRVRAPVWRATCSLQAFRALQVTDTRIVDTLVAMAAAAAAAHHHFVGDNYCNRFIAFHCHSSRKFCIRLASIAVANSDLYCIFAPPYSMTCIRLWFLNFQKWQTLTCPFPIECHLLD